MSAIAPAIPVTRATQTQWKKALIRNRHRAGTSEHTLQVPAKSWTPCTLQVRTGGGGYNGEAGGNEINKSGMQVIHEFGQDK
jgi:hypothetical protein